MASKNQKKKNSKKRRPKRVFTPEFRADVVRVCQAEGETVAKVCRRLELTQSAVRGWIAKAESEEAFGPATSGVTTNEREELQRLRRENKQLKMEREILKKAAMFVCHARVP